MFLINVHARLILMLSCVSNNQTCITAANYVNSPKRCKTGALNQLSWRPQMMYVQTQ